MNAKSRLIVALVMMGAGLAARADVPVADEVESAGVSFSGVNYGVSERFDRAWLVLHFTETGPCLTSDGDCEIDHPLRVRVPGLTFDRATRQVLFQEGGGAPATCAKVVRHRFLFSWESIDSTGQCVYHLEKHKLVVDDGYEGKEERRQMVYLGVKR